MSIVYSLPTRTIFTLWTSPPATRGGSRTFTPSTLSQTVQDYVHYRNVRDHICSSMNLALQDRASCYSRLSVSISCHTTSLDHHARMNSSEVFMLRVVQYHIRDSMLIMCLRRLEMHHWSLILNEFQGPGSRNARSQASHKETDTPTSIMNGTSIIYTARMDMLHIICAVWKQMLFLSESSHNSPHPSLPGDIMPSLPCVLCSHLYISAGTHLSPAAGRVCQPTVYRNRKGLATCCRSAPPTVSPQPWQIFTCSWGWFWSLQVERKRPGSSYRMSALLFHQ